MSAGADLRALPGLRRRSALEQALGPAVAAALSAPDVTEALINADGALWLDRAGSGLSDTGIRLTPGDREAAIRLIAHEAGQTAGPDRPLLSAILPESGARVQAALPPVVAAPVLAIRKRAEFRVTLGDYVAAGIAAPEQARALADAVEAGRNIVVAGGAGSGKTTLLNALMAEPAFLAARLIVLEDTAELQVPGPNCVQLLTHVSDPEITLRDLVRAALRMRPGRIIVGEVRSGAALDVLKAWNTGHSGGLLTLHANSAADALARLEDLCLEAAPLVPARLIRSAVDMIVFITRTPGLPGRRITEILDLRALEGDLT